MKSIYYNLIYPLYGLLLLGLKFLFKDKLLLNNWYIFVCIITICLQLGLFLFSKKSNHVKLQRQKSIELIPLIFSFVLGIVLYFGVILLTKTTVIRITNIKDILLYAAFMPIIEEIIFRGIISKIKNVNPVLLCIFSGLFFSLYHSSSVQKIFTFLLGFLFMYIARKYSFIFSCLLHMGLNYLGISCSSSKQVLMIFIVASILMIICIITNGRDFNKK